MKNKRLYKMIWVLSLLWSSFSFADIGLPPGELPVKVKAALYIADLDSIDTAGQGFEARVFYELRWHDARLAHGGDGPISKQLSEVWNPRMRILNQQKTWSTFSEMVRVMPDGEVIYYKGLWGSFSQPLELKNFPFDSQKFSLQMVTGYLPHQVQFIADDSGHSGIAESLSVADWKVLNWEVDLTPFNFRNIAQRSAITFSFNAKRLTSYYVVKMIFPLVMIVMMSWAVFWMDPLNVASNVSISITSMLTLIAYRFLADTILPRLSYLTSLDYFILASSVLVFLSLVQNLTTSALAKGGSPNMAYRLDVACRIGFPVLFLLVAIETLYFRSFL